MSKDNCYNDVVHSAVAVLKKGGTLLYPTDTIWGIGCDASNAAAVEKIYAIKERDHNKSMLILCSDMDMVERYVGRVGEASARLLLSSDRPTTVILPLSLSRLADNLTASDGTIGVRIPRMEFCHELLRLFGRPIVSTSANLSGRPSPSGYKNIETELISRVDYCVPSAYERTTDGISSRIVKVDAVGNVVVIRE